MILYTDATTPFGRKCLVAALERAIVLEECFVSLADPGEFLEINPLNQIPALAAEADVCHFDSDVILQYLDTRHDGPSLIPATERFRHLTAIHLANGVIESTLLRIMETRRPAGEKSPGFIAHLEARIARGIDRMARDRTAPTSGPLSAEEITTAVALDYVDFRHPHDWRSTAPNLAAWHEAIAARPSFSLSRPTRDAPTHSPPRFAA